MGVGHIRRTEIVTSSDSADVSGTPFRIAGQAFDVHMAAPADLFQIEVSDDCVDWEIATDIDANSMTSVGNTAPTYRVIRERPEWVRMTVLTDAGGPRDFPSIIGVFKDL